ncbi:MAG: hypothetical protein KME52_07600 [Desmonostoc geniculatum HA4340-LM1]|jgi:hypothetical protein|nr:hypothetical protein [Desmonostoc geniculatum HA4340-LM1]
MVIDTTQRIAQMPIISLSGVDCLQGKGLRYVFSGILFFVYNAFKSGVDLVAENLTGQSLLDELPTDWVKSELMETRKSRSSV